MEVVAIFNVSFDRTI